MLKIEVRGETAIISGYVNACERYSKPIKETLHGKVRTFIERVKAGAFSKALRSNDNVKVLLNHDGKRELANTKDGTAKLEEDSIGLRAEVTITDKEVVEKAKNNQLSGWSFGFYANDDVMGMESGTETRTITDLDLVEVSILDNTKSPAYYGTSIEARSEDNKMLEIRNANLIEKTEIRNDIYLEDLAEKIADILIERWEKKQEEAEEKRAIDYSDYEKRLKKI